MGIKRVVIGIVIALCLAVIAFYGIAAIEFRAMYAADHYLVAPYLDLDAIGGRGSPYALTR